eukprot:5560586-Pleurochrysis_carterae.AAC.4
MHARKTLHPRALTPSARRERLCAPSAIVGLADTPPRAPLQGEHRDVQAVAYSLMAIWPIGMPLLCEWSPTRLTILSRSDNGTCVCKLCRQGRNRACVRVIGHKLSVA